MNALVYRATIVLVAITYAAMVYADYATADGEWECHADCEP